MEDDGSRSGQGFWREALYVALSFCMVGLSHGLSCDRMQLCAVQRGGQFIVMQLDVSWQFIVMQPDMSWQFRLMRHGSRRAGNGE